MITNNTIFYEPLTQEVDTSMSELAMYDKSEFQFALHSC